MIWPRKIKFFAVAGPWQGSRSFGDFVEGVGDFKQVDDVLAYVGDFKDVDDVVERAGDVNEVGDTIKSVSGAKDVDDVVEHAGDINEVGDGVESIVGVTDGVVESIVGATDVDVVESLFSCNFKRFSELVSPSSFSSLLSVSALDFCSDWLAPLILSFLKYFVKRLFCFDIMSDYL